MNINFSLSRVNCLFIYICAFLFILHSTSCTKDNVKETIENEVDPDSETDEDMPDENTLSDIVFEEGTILDADRSFVNLVLSDSEYSKFIAGEGDLNRVSQKMYTYLKDDYDFIIILSVEEEQPAGLFYGRSTSVQNLVQGIGGGVYDLSTTYGSAGKLKSIIYMPKPEYINSGPFLHEIAHTWANKGFLPSTVGGHWGYAGTGGQLGGFDELIDNGDGTYLGRMNGQDGFAPFANGGNSIPYSNVELYVMGLIPATELESVVVAVNPEAGNSFGAFSADGIEEHTKGMMISANGPRIPDTNDAQKIFNALTVVISKSTIDTAKKNALNIDLKNFSRQGAPDWNSSYNFHTATQGKASFSFALSDQSIK